MIGVMVSVLGCDGVKGCAGVMLLV